MARYNNKNVNYYERYQEVKNMKAGTIRYFKAVKSLFKIKNDRQTLNKIRELRKNEAYKKGKTFSQAFEDFQNGTNYENGIKIRDYKIFTGEYFKERTSRYYNNYLSALEKNGISQDIIDFLRKNPDIVKSGALPPITEFYEPSLGKGAKYSLNLDDSDYWEANIREFLIYAYDAEELDIEEIRFKKK